MKLFFFGTLLFFSINTLHAKNIKINIKRLPSSSKINYIILNGQYAAQPIRALPFDQSNEPSQLIHKIIEENANNVCAFLGYKLEGFDDIELIDFEDRDPTSHVVVSNNSIIKREMSKKYFSFKNIYCSYTDNDDANLCILQTHGSKDALFIQTRRKDNCKK